MGDVGLRVLVDADVLWSRTLRDWVLLMSAGQVERPLFSVWWTEDVLAEAVARMRDARPDLPSGALEQIGDRLRDLWAEGRITNFTARRESFVGQDEGDLHVHSAAVAGGVDMVVTNDRRGLLPPAGRLDLLDLLPYEILRADDFLVLIHEQAPHLVVECLRRQRGHYRARGGSPDFVESLRRAGAPRFAERVRWELVTLDVNER